MTHTHSLTSHDQTCEALTAVC